ncbi:hypothetical protein [Brachybacterium sacelli]|uniref:Uncharacterized protein n=2 Tax=Brachybacterium sacelli TaxID=173364 RepID=A0ABS4X0X1_9MICO|nr:hypothetical protein [Brachybacterium sacelli]MBP2382094.1 hypothetical protein [Brachybacterium sacelli]
MDDETDAAPRPSTAPDDAAQRAQHSSALAPSAVAPVEERGLRDRATAGAAALGAAALLVMSFGPAALAVSPSGTAEPSHDRVWVSPLEGGDTEVTAPPRTEDEDVA